MFRQRDWQQPLWWLAVLAVAVLLKRHYSFATVAELDWMLRPLTLMLEWLTGHAFHRDGNLEWVSASAGVRLVKACAGINFMLMSLLVYAWLFRPDRRAHADPPATYTGQLLLLCAAVVAAWATSLGANTLRIVSALAVRAQGWDFATVGLDAAQLHRMLGMAIYVPLLSLQMLAGRRSTVGQALAAPALLYLLLMGVVPLLTGNALRQPALYLEHLRHMAACLALPGGVYLLYRCWPRTGRCRAG